MIVKDKQKQGQERPWLLLRSGSGLNCGKDGVEERGGWKVEGRCINRLADTLHVEVRGRDRGRDRWQGSHSLKVEGYAEALHVGLDILTQPDRSVGLVPHGALANSYRA